MKQSWFMIKQSWLSAITLGLLTACINTDYDLTKDVDLTMKIGGSQFAVPGGSTAAISIGDYLTLSANSVVKTDADGNYYLQQAGSTTQATFSVPAFQLDRIADVVISAKITDFVQAATLPTGTVWRASLPHSYSGTLSFTANNVPEEITALSSVVCPATATITFAYPKGVAKQVQIENAYIKVPDYVTLGNIAHSDNLIPIPAGAVITESEGYTFTIPVAGIDFSKVGADQGLQNGAITLSGEVNVSGGLMVKADDVYATSFSGVALTSTLKIQGASSTNIAVTSVMGTVSKTVDIAETIVTIDDIPDFIADNEVTLDVKNPTITYTLTNGSPISATVSGTVKSWKTVSAATSLASVDFSLPAVATNSTQVFTLSHTGEAPQGSTGVAVPQLSALINKVPDVVSLTAQASTVGQATVTLGKDYNVAADYELLVPFVFGENLTIVYRDSIKGWKDDLEDVEAKQLRVTARAVSKVPLNLQFVVTPLTLDANGNSVTLDVLTATVKTLTDGQESDIVPGGSDTAPSVVPLVIELTETVSGAAKQLDGIAIRAIATSKGLSGAQLNANQTIQLTDVRLKVPTGAIVNFN